MKYALKPSSRVLDVKGSNKIIFFKDEKQLINFFHEKMKLDLTNPVVKSEKYNWRDRNKPNDIAATDVTGIYSLLISSNVTLEFLSWSSRVGKFIHEKIGGSSKGHWQYWKILSRMRSLPCNWTLYTLEEGHDHGSVLKQVGWGNFFRMAKKENLFAGIDLSYRLPEGEA
jgi:hypothetical protein